MRFKLDKIEKGFLMFVKMKIQSFIILGLALNSTYGLSQSTIHQQVKNYETSEAVKITLNYLHKNVLPASKGACAAYVRKGYTASGLFSGPTGIEYAKDYHPFLLREGWTDLFAPNASSLRADLNMTPSGCAVVYSAIDPQNDRNGYIGHIEVRTKRKTPGYISDYFSVNPRTGLECEKKGTVSKKLRTFVARSSSPFHKAGKKVQIYINVTNCHKYSNKGASISDEFLNRKVTGVFCKLE